MADPASPKPGAPRDANQPRAVRGMMDSIVQGATVDLFASYGVAVAPLPRSVRPSFGSSGGMLGSITFSGNSLNGTLSIDIPPEILTLSKAEVGQPFRARDWMRELTNQLMGRIKGRLLQFQVYLRTGLPTIVDQRVTHGRRESTERTLIYVFRTLRGEVVVVLEGSIDESALVYSGTSSASEGDIILF